MSKHERMARIEGINLETGAFDMTLATEGEASDGDILSIKGGQIPERMPMLNSHYNSATETLGSITDPQKLLKDSPPRLRGVGRIEMGGEGEKAAIRRDLAYMIDKGHVVGMSIRWDDVPGKSVRRVNLPSDHPYFVDSETEKDMRKRYGIYFEEWRAMEGSVVALGADPQALIGRAAETEGGVSTFWRAMALETEEPESHQPTAEEVEEAIETTSDRVLADQLDSDPEADAAAALSVLRIQVNDCREAGVDAREMCEAFIGSLAEKEAESIRVAFRQEDAADEETHDEENEELLAQLVETREKLEASEARATAAEAALEEERVKADPLSAPNPLEAIERFLAEKDPHLQAIYLRKQRGQEVSPLDLVRNLKAGLEEDREGVVARFREIVEQKRGKVKRDDETE